MSCLGRWYEEAGIKDLKVKRVSESGHSQRLLTGLSRNSVDKTNLDFNLAKTRFNEEVENDIGRMSGSSATKQYQHTKPALRNIIKTFSQAALRFKSNVNINRAGNLLQPLTYMRRQAALLQPEQEAEAHHERTRRQKVLLPAHHEAPDGQVLPRGRRLGHLV